MAQLVKNPPAMQKNPVQFLGLGWCPGEEKGYPLQYFGLDYTVHGVAKRRLSDFEWLSLHFIVFSYFVARRVCVQVQTLQHCSKGSQVPGLLNNFCCHSHSPSHSLLLLLSKDLTMQTQLCLRTGAVAKDKYQKPEDLKIIPLYSFTYFLENIKI